MSHVSSPRESFVSMLTVEPLRNDEFVVCLEDFWGSSLGGDVLARTALAAADTCEGKELHSLHACFLAPDFAFSFNRAGGILLIGAGAGPATIRRS